MQKLGLMISGAALAGSLLMFISTGGFTAGSTLQEIRGDIRLLRHEVLAANALQDTEIKQIKLQLKPN
ncbi:hypothetical protein [Cylindrospermum sp. FACHB-282]|uniref:hypothetical protein n=1 Tax=Cylindrospermum sp. FACHB-282 TaxID=2692794 RepID=UPI001687A21F|nr:hypothetical protein [Cylindrospermum sp. FACHB-282]MBD2387465.1 hypothetical protein [Cylindrospermum sp. FACHB-282]